jgi:N-acetylglucosaminyl-diphospho-decaprenol L-rhamnosyltransferase
LISMQELSIVAVTYRSAPKLPAFLDAARSAAPNAELVIVDNGSDDDTLEVAKRHAPSASLLCSGTNLGFGRGCNLGASEAGGEWLLFLNPDVELRKLALPRRNTAACGGIWSGLIFARGAQRPVLGLRADTSSLEDYLTQLFFHFLPPRVASAIPVRRRPSGWASGAMLLTRKQDFQRVGGFDPSYFLYYEDRDLGAKYRSHGMTIGGLSGLVAHHSPGTSSSDVSASRREAWSYLSWFEYLASWRGYAAARRAACMVHTVLARAVRLADSRGTTDRVRQKALDIADVLQYMTNFDDHLPSVSGPYYPYARLALSDLASRERRT